MTPQRELGHGRSREKILCQRNQAIKEMKLELHEAEDQDEGANGAEPGAISIEFQAVPFFYLYWQNVELVSTCT